MTSSWTTASKIQEANRLKDEGNLLVKAGEHKKALKSYKYVALYMNGLIDEENQEMAKFSSGNLLTKEEAIAVKDLKVNSLSNLALCYAKLENPEKMAEMCQKVLALNPNHVKSLCRLGNFLVERKKFDQAKKMLLHAYALEPQNEACQKELRNFKTKFEEWEKVQNEKQRQAFGGKLFF